MTAASWLAPCIDTSVPGIGTGSGRTTAFMPKCISLRTPYLRSHSREGGLVCDLALGTRPHGSCTLYYTWPMPQVSIVSPIGNIGNRPQERHTTLSRIGGGGEIGSTHTYVHVGNPIPPPDKDPDCSNEHAQTTAAPKPTRTSHLQTSNL